MPAELTADQTPKARARAAGSVKATVSKDSAVGVMAAAPSPCSARPPNRTKGIQARPASSEPAAKSSRPTTSTRRRP
jgi:hypothetical protein